MAAPVVIRNVVDTWANSSRTTKNYGSTSRMYVGNGIGYSYLTWANPVPPKGAKIIKAVLHLRQGEAWSGTNTVTAVPVASSWSVNRLTWANRPSTGSGSATQTKGATASGTEWVLDITSIMQSVAAGTKWYGLRLSVASNGGKSFATSQATASVRPYVEITWSSAPNPPVDLVPRSGFATSDQNPVMQWDYVGDKSQQSFQVQIADSAAFTNILYDSGEVFSPNPELDLNSTSFLATSGATYYWRVRTRDVANYWSNYSAIETFRYVPLGTVTITNPADGANPYVEEPSPPVTWTTSFAQSAYQILVYDAAVPAKALWDSGRIASTDQIATVKAGPIKDTGKKYTIVVRAWDAQSRIMTSGAPTYAESSRTVTLQLSANTTPVNNLTIAADSRNLKYTLTFFRGTLPDYMYIKRDGIIIAQDLDPTAYQSSTDPTKFTFTDLPSGRTSHTYEVVCVVNGKSSSANPTVTVNVKRPLTWMLDSDGNRPVALHNPGFEFADNETSGVVTPLAGRPFLVTQNVSGETGTGSGRIADGEVSGLTARAMRDNLRQLRSDRGGEAILLTADEAMLIYFFNLKVQRVPMPNGTTEYDVSFDFIEGPDL